ncbi:hypothetical protein pb186bvf_018404 [Paramecium bursaria]
MYNNIGLMTPRGSGTSGYVQKNLSKMKRVKNRDEFIKQIQSMKDNVIDARKAANPDIVLHEQKRDIEVKKLMLRDELEAKGLSEQEIEERLNSLEQKLKKLLDEGKYSLNHIKDTHSKIIEKDKQEEKLKNAFGIDTYKPGSAFDFDTQERERLENKYKRELKKAEQLIQLKEKKKAEKKQLKEQLKLKQEEEEKKVKQEKSEKQHDKHEKHEKKLKK